jgi:tetratricopeptide (TPR) repeat protein
MANILAREDNIRIAILGGGGMGKTSTALHILHHSAVKARYGQARYFVGCDSVISGGALALLILQIIQHKIAPNENSSDILYRALSSYPCILLLLDNFETVWNSESNRADIRELLSKIVSLPKVSLIITSRGDMPPSGVKWTHIDCLPPLSPESAKELFLDLHYGETGDFEGDHTLMMLLKELDYIPLAIHLIVQACSGFSLRHMLKLWRDKRTALLQTRGTGPDKLESIEVSISISLSSLDSTNNHQAVQLLATLCLLPDGLLHWEERLLDIGSRFENVHGLLQSLRRTSLVFISNDVLKVLSPIRHFVTVHHPAAEGHVKVLEAYFWNLVATYATCRPGHGFIKATQILEPEMGNLCSLVQNNIQHQPTTETIEIALQISLFSIWTHPLVEILNPIVSMAADLKVGTPSLQAKCSQCLGDILRIQCNIEEAADVLKKARDQFIEIGDQLGASQCSKSLGNILHIQSNYEEAANILKETGDQFIKIGNQLGAAQCSQSLGDILSMQDNYEEAADVLKKAQDQFIKIGDHLGAAQCSQSLDNILRMQDNYKEAADVLKKTQDQFIKIGNQLGAAQCSQSLGDILSMQGNYEEAVDVLKKTQGLFIKIGDQLGATQCSQSLGNILCMQDNYEEAADVLKKVRDQFIKIGNQLGAAQCLQSLGNILHMQDNYEEAADVLKKARDQFVKIRDQLGAAQCSQSLGDILSMQGNYEEAVDVLKKAQDQFVKIGDQLGAAQCSHSLGNILHMQDNYKENADVLKKAQDQYIVINLV